MQQWITLRRYGDALEITINANHIVSYKPSGGEEDIPEHGVVLLSTKEMLSVRETVDDITELLNEAEDVLL